MQSLSDFTRKRFLLNIFRNVHFSEIDRYIGCVRLFCRQPHKGSFDQLVSPSDPQFQDYQVFPLIFLQESIQTFFLRCRWDKIGTDHMDLHETAALRAARHQFRRDFPALLFRRHFLRKLQHRIQLLMAIYDLQNCMGYPER